VLEGAKNVPETVAMFRLPGVATSFCDSVKGSVTPEGSGAICIAPFTTPASMVPLKIVVGLLNVRLPAARPTT